MKIAKEYHLLRSGSTFAEFKIFLIKDFDVCIPPIGLQESFAAFVAQVDKSKSVVQAALGKLKILQAALMQEDFS